MSRSTGSWIALMCFLLAVIFIPANAMSYGPPRRAGRISNITDTRVDGISYVFQHHRAEEYMRSIYPGKRASDFLTAGNHWVRIHHGSNRAAAEQQDRFIAQLLDASIHQKSIWKLEIGGEPAYSSSSHTNWTAVSTLVGYLPRITEVHWDASKLISQTIMDALHTHHPTSKLFYKFPRNDYERRRNRRLERADPEWRAIQQAKDQVEIFQPLLNSPVLHSLEVKAEQGMWTTSHMLNFIVSLLQTCSNFRELDFSYGERDYDRYNPRRAFNLTNPNIKLPPLEVLKLQNYDFEAKPDGLGWKEWETENPDSDILKLPWSKMPMSIINWVGYPRIESWGGLSTRLRYKSPLKPGERTNLDVWLEVMDWTHIHTLRLEDFHLQSLTKLQGNVLPSLRNLDLVGGYYDNVSVYLDFLREASQLESLSLSRLTFTTIEPLETLFNIVEEHHPGLQVFKLNIYACGACTRCAPYQRPFLNSTLLTRLIRSCPAIHTLDIGVEVRSEWEYDLFDTLSAIDGLRHLTLRFEAVAGSGEYEYLGASSHQNKKEDEAERSLMEGLLLYLNKKKVGKAYDTLKVFVGGREIVSGGERKARGYDRWGLMEDDPDEYDWNEDIGEYSDEAELIMLQEQMEEL